MRTTPGDSRAGTLSPVTITLRRFLFTGKYPPPSTRNAGAGAGRGCFGAREGVLSAGAFREFVPRPAASLRRGFFLGIASARRGPPTPWQSFCRPPGPMRG